VPLLQSERPALQAEYKQVVPLQLVAPVGTVAVSHLSPQAEQLVMVLSVVQVLPHVVSRQEQGAVALTTQSGVGWAHGLFASTQAPAGLHVSGVLPLHPFAPGLHATQVVVEGRQTGVAPEHVVCVCHVPVASHIWTTLPMHRTAFEPGVHWSHVAEVVEVL
jgi:hypothetical protein